VIARLGEFHDGETIYAEAPTPTARAVVAAEPHDGSVPAAAAGLDYLLEVEAAREAIDVWRFWRAGRAPSLDEKVDAVLYFAVEDAYLLTE
jgi:hypothetical protein